MMATHDRQRRCLGCRSKNTKGGGRATTSTHVLKNAGTQTIATPLVVAAAWPSPPTSHKTTPRSGCQQRSAERTMLCATLPRRRVAQSADRFEIRSESVEIRAEQGTKKESVGHQRLMSDEAMRRRYAFSQVLQTDRCSSWQTPGLARHRSGAHCHQWALR